MWKFFALCEIRIKAIFFMNIFRTKLLPSLNIYALGTKWPVCGSSGDWDLPEHSTDKGQKNQRWAFPVWPVAVLEVLQWLGMAQRELGANRPPHAEPGWEAWKTSSLHPLGNLDFRSSSSPLGVFVVLKAEFFWQQSCIVNEVCFLWFPIKQLWNQWQVS